MRSILFVVFVFLGFILRAQVNKTVKQAYEALSIFDYFKAKHLFYKSISKETNSPAAYGLSLIYGRHDNPFSQSDSAYKYAQVASLLFQKTPQSIAVSGFTMDGASLQNQIASCVQSCYAIALASGNTHGWDKFLGQIILADPDLKSEALYKRDELEFNTMASLNHSLKTLQFLKTHPQSQFYGEATQLQQRQIYEEMCSTKRAEDYKRFLNDHPHNRMRNTALENLYGIYRKNNDVQGLVFFVHSYPMASQANEAWKLLFSLSVRSYSDEELIRFLAMYPEFPLRNTILKELQMSSKRFLAFYRDDMYGYIDTNGTVSIPAQYDAVSVFKEELALVNRNDSVWFINKLNENVFNQSYEDAYGFDAGVAPVKRNGRWKFINRQGQVISPDYEEINELSDGLYVLKVKGRYGALDRFGQNRVEARYDYLGNFSKGFAPYREAEKYGFVSLSGYVHKAEFDWISAFNENGIAVVRKPSGFGLLHRSGRIVLETNYDQVLEAGNGVYILVKDKHYGFYSAEGCFLSALEFDYAKENPPEYYVQKDWFRLVKNKSLALMDANGALRVNYGVYEDCGFFNEGLLRVKKKKKYGFVDRKLQTAIPYQYTWAEDFADSVALVKKGDLFEGIDVFGRSLFNSPFKIQRLHGRYFLIETPEGKKLLNSRGQLLLETIEHEEALEAPYFLFSLKNGEIKLLKL